MQFLELLNFIENDMRMSHVYQPVMLREMILRGGTASTAEIARALLNEDQSQLEYYVKITGTMVGKVLKGRGIVRKEGGQYILNVDSLAPAESDALVAACEERLAGYVESRGKAIWSHRRLSSGYISGTVRYEVLKAAKFRCELCGISADQRALEVDHILPRSRGGSDEMFNLQALCYSCNAMKRDRDSTDFRAVRDSYGHREAGCIFCSLGDRRVLFENELAVAFLDLFPVTEGHVLIVPKRHVATYFDLGTAEVRGCHELIHRAKAMLHGEEGVVDFNIGINCGSNAGQTVMHCHIHLIPRRPGDHPNPRGGVRAVIPAKADYLAAA